MSCFVSSGNMAGQLLTQENTPGERIRTIWKSAFFETGHSPLKRRAEKSVAAQPGPYRPAFLVAGLREEVSS